MAINVQRYALLYEKYKGMGLGEREAQQRAEKEASVMPDNKKKKESAIKRLARLTKMAALGKHYKSEWQRKREKQKKPFETVRTKATSRELRKAGLTEDELNRLKGRR